MGRIINWVAATLVIVVMILSLSTNSAIAQNSENHWQYLDRFDWSVTEYQGQIHGINLNLPPVFKEINGVYYHGFWEETEKNMTYKISYGQPGDMKQIISTVENHRTTGIDFVILDEEIYIVTSRAKEYNSDLYLYTFDFSGEMLREEKLSGTEGAENFATIPIVNLQTNGHELFMVFSMISNRNPLAFYERRTLEGELLQSKSFLDFSTAGTRTTVLPYFQFSTDDNLGTKIFYKRVDALIMAEIDVESNISHKEIASAPHRIGDGGEITTYAYGDIAPLMVTDSKGYHHIVYTHHTMGPGLGVPFVMDVGYLKVSPTGELVDQRIISNERGISHFPTINIDGNDNLYIAWEDDSHENGEGYFSKINSSGEVSINQQRITWDRSYTKFPQVLSDKEGNIHSIWLNRETSALYHLYYRNNIESAPNSLWLKLGVNPYTKESVIGQFAYFVGMSLLTSVMEVIKNGGLIIVILLVFAAMNKIGLLYLLQDKPYALFQLVLVVIWLLAPKLELSHVIMDISQGYHLGAGLFMGAVSIGILKLAKLTPSSSMNVLMGMVVWLFGYYFLLNYPIMATTFMV